MGKLNKLLFDSSVILFSIMIYSAGSAFAQQPADHLQGRLAYPLNKSFVMYDYSNNIDEINSLHAYITKTLNDPTLTISSIEITGYSSPEGSFEQNEQLALQRAENLKDYLRPFFAEAEIHTAYVPEDWDGLVDALRNAGHPELDRIREIAEADLTPQQKENRLRKLPASVYRELSRNYFPLLRKATLHIRCQHAEAADSIQADTYTYAAGRQLNTEERYIRSQQNNLQYRNSQLYRQNLQNTVLADRYGRSYCAAKRRQVVYSPYAAADRQPTFAIGTNLLEWAGFRPDFSHTTVIPNIYIEYYFLKRWSAKAAFSYCDWSYSDGKRYQGLSSYSVEPRFWWKNDGTFRGLFLGVYGQAGDYNQKCPLENYTGKYYSGGVSAGYLFPLYKGLAVEVSLRAGYRHATVKKYQAGEECSDLCRSYSKNEFTITGSFLNLLYRF